ATHGGRKRISVSRQRRDQTQATDFTARQRLLQLERRKTCYANISHAENIVFVFAHSNGDYLRFSDSSVDCNTFRLHLHKDRDASHPVLLILNCCLSVSGGEGGSLLSAAARKGFCGLVGTEAETL